MLNYQPVDCKCTEALLCEPHLLNRMRVAKLYQKDISMLTPGQVIRRHGGDLWKVTYVNECRAHIVPMAFSTRKQAITAPEDDATRGLDISPNGESTVVTDLDKAAIELELAHAERELAAAKREMAKQEQDKLAEAQLVNEIKLQQELAKAEAELAELEKQVGEVASIRRTAYWTIAPGDHGFFAAGSLKAEVMAFLKAHPGATTKQVAESSKASAGAVAACLDRFWKAGVLVKG